MNSILSIAEVTVFLPSERSPHHVRQGKQLPQNRRRPGLNEVLGMTFPKVVKYEFGLKRKGFPKLLDLKSFSVLRSKR